ncbi:MAG: class I mannose-6-phosphate isomerase [Verrucomicrobiota bacterium JB022]|nr:class I mannose-6-phosphate isomerase [Verrucomicrobiota bacterium JB022]
MDLLPLLPNRVWRTYPGGRELDRLEGKPVPRDDHWPEDWLASTTRAINPHPTRDDEGLAQVELAGERRYFRDLLQAHAQDWLGAAHVARHGPEPRVLVKLLDAAVRLHFQAHPTAAFAQQHGLGPSGKAEAYHILSIRPEVAEPYIYLGFQHPPTRAELKRMIEQQDLAALEACFERIPVQPGDTFFIPGGFPHAIGEGIMMVEIMEPSDLAVRFEFEKAGYVLPESARFMGRGLDFCLDVFNYDAVSVETMRQLYAFRPHEVRKWEGSGKHYHLIGPETTPCFRVDLSVFDGPSRRPVDQAFIGIVTGGRGTIQAGRREWTVEPFDRFFVPASSGGLDIRPVGSEPLKLLECLPPEA